MKTLVEDTPVCPKTSYLISQVKRLTNDDEREITNARMQIISDGGKTNWINLTESQVAQIFINLMNEAEFEHEAAK